MRSVSPRPHVARGSGLAVVIAVVLATAIPSSLGSAPPPAEQGDASLGLGNGFSDSRAVVAAFERRSYRPGDVARLRLFGRYSPLHIELLHVGPESEPTIGNGTIEGVVVAQGVRLGTARDAVRLRIGDWESGFYAARLKSRGRIGFAPFIIRPRRLGLNRVAVVQPTYTWQAYNRRSVGGRPGTWYQSQRHTTVELWRPYLSRGVPPYFRQYDASFLRWLAHTGRRVDMLAQEDFELLSSRRLARLYRLIVFPGHHEYVTEAEYDAVKRYRDLGGNLAFLSANNFFWRVRRRGETITRIGRWRDLGRPEAALVGVQFFEWNRGAHRSTPYTVRGAELAPWLFAGTGLGDGTRFGQFGVEVDRRAPASPRSIRVLATIENVFATGHPAEMTLYETQGGARVFAAGAFTLAGTQLRQPTLSRFLENLWNALSAPG
jgi:hypothetical protein